MIGIDTNVLIRYITQDDEEQAAIASKWIESCSAESPGWVSVIVHMNQAAGCECTITFDKKASEHRLVRLLK